MTPYSEFCGIWADQQRRLSRRESIPRVFHGMLEVLGSRLLGAPDRRRVLRNPVCSPKSIGWGRRMEQAGEGSQGVAAGDRVVAPLRLGGAALVHPGHHLRLRALISRRGSPPTRSRARRCGAMRRPPPARHRRLSPFFGAIADPAARESRGSPPFGAHRRGSPGCGSRHPGSTKAISIALVAFAVGTIGVEFATVFNNAMMPDLVDEDRLGRLSGTGWAVGYVGGLVCLVIMLGLFVADPRPADVLRHPARLRPRPGALRGRPRLRPVHRAWYLVFVLPLFLFTPDAPRRLAVRAASARPHDLAATLRGLRRDANAVRFLLANMIYTDGLVALFVFGGIYAAGIFGWTSIELGLFGILLIVAGIFGVLFRRPARRPDRPEAVVVGSLVILALATADPVDRRDPCRLRLPGRAARGRRPLRLDRRAGLPALGVVIGPPSGRSSRRAAR